MRRTLSEIERRSDLEKARDGAAEQLDRGRRRLEPLEAQRAEARAASRRFNAALAEVYRDPAAARREFNARARREGTAAASAEIARRPEQFGALRGTQLGPVRSVERSHAIANAARLESLGADHLRTTSSAWTRRDEYRAARAAVAGLETKIAELDVELARGGGSARLTHRLSRELRPLRPEQRRAVQRSLPLPQRRIFSATIAAAQSFAREQGHER